MNACIKRLVLWCNIQSVSLTIDIRAQLGGSAGDPEFSKNLLYLGDGKITYYADGEIHLMVSLFKQCFHCKKLSKNSMGILRL